FGEERVGNWLVEFDRLVIDAAGLDPVPEVIDDVRRDDTVEGDWLQKPVFFGEFFHFFAVGFLVLALVDHFCGQALAGGELIFNPKTIRVGELHGFVAPAYTSLAAAHVTQLRTLRTPPATEQIFYTRAHRQAEVFQLGGVLVFESSGCRIKDPSMVAVISLNQSLAATDELSAFFVGIHNVVDELHGNPRYPIFVFGEEAMTDNCLDAQIAVATHDLDGALHNLLGLIVRSCFFRFGLSADLTKRERDGDYR